jgi:hypothetical protein
MPRIVTIPGKDDDLDHQGRGLKADFDVRASSEPQRFG